ncbi:TetR-like C-terminal domain-containing protein, partial [Roseibium sp. RKSG952]|uniref:TetR-like C-terminal domain-containing protein n=1 Tax=Roseibium sp. RKSG952 TaxID=2529384 RepID=UPI0012BD3C38
PSPAKFATEPNRTTLYRRWGTKARLIAWVLLEHQKTNLPQIDTGSVEADLVELMLLLDNQLNSQIGRWFIQYSAIEAANDPTVASAMQTFWQARLEAVSGLVRRGVPRGEIDPEADIPFLLEQVFGAYYFRLIRNPGQPLSREDAARYVRCALSGAAAVQHG